MLQHFIYVMCGFCKRVLNSKFKLKMSLKMGLKNKNENLLSSLFLAYLAQLLLAHALPSLSLLFWAGPV
jgi:hypothetical protein